MSQHMLKISLYLRQSPSQNVFLRRKYPNQAARALQKAAKMQSKLDLLIDD